MKTNMGTLDRLVRLVLIAPVAIALAFWLGFAKTAGIVLLAVGAIMALTSALGFCPLYAPFGINTCGRDKRSGPSAA